MNVGLFWTLVFRNYLCTLAYLVQPRYSLGKQYLMTADYEAINHLPRLVVEDRYFGAGC